MNNEKTGGPRPPELSPKLKMIAAQIKQILIDNDVAGTAFIFEPGFMEMTIHISPSYSVVALNETHQLRINPPSEDPGAPEIHKKKIADTVNMLAHMRLRSGQLSLTFTKAEIAVRDHFKIEPPKKPGQPLITPPNFLNGKKRKN